MNKSGLPGMLRSGWLRIGNQNQILYRWLKTFVLDISCPVTVISALPKLFSDTYQQIQNAQASHEVSYFSAITDLWTSYAEDPFLSFTVHYISSQWWFLSNCLCVQAMLWMTTQGKYKKKLCWKPC